MNHRTDSDRKDERENAEGSIGNLAVKYNPNLDVPLCKDYNMTVTKQGVCFTPFLI